MNKRIYTAILAILTMTMAMPTMAQKGLNINNLFDGRYRDNDHVTETVIQGGNLDEYDLDLYHSLTLTDSPEEAASIEALVSHDGASAVEREVSYRDGGLYYAFYEFKPSVLKRRYLFFLNQHRNKGNKIIVIYLEGMASRDKIKQMLK